MLQREHSSVLSNFNFKHLIVELLSKNVSTDDKLDIIIFGANGHAGRYTVLEAVTVLKDYKWGIAGRNVKKLEKILSDIGKKAQTDLSNIPITIADLSNKNSLMKLLEKCRVLVNCCGPYYLNGEPLLRACIAAGTHYVDLCNEPQFMEMMQLKYHEEARLQNVYVVSGCGLQSLPIDLGVNYMREEFDGTINNIDVYIEYSTTKSNIVWPMAGCGSWASFVLACANLREIPSIRKRLHRKEFPNLKPKSRYKGVLHESDIVRKYCLPFPFFDQQVLERTQYHNYDKQQRRPIQFNSYLAFPSYLVALIFLLWFVVVALLAQIQCTRDLLLKYPKLCSFGFFSPDGPNESSMESTFLKYTLHAAGWAKEENRIKYDCDDKLDKQMTARISGMNPVYGVSCCCVLVSAITILQAANKKYANYGVMTPGVAFADTDIIAELDKHDHGLCFEIIKK